MSEGRQRSKIFERPVERNSLRRTLNFYNYWALLYEISEMINILNVEGEPIFDNRIVKFEFHVHTSTMFEHSDEIKISIQHDLYTLFVKTSLR